MAYEALKRGNQIRSYRAAFKRKIKARELDREQVIEVVAEPPPELSTMELEPLVAALPAFAKVKARTLLRRARLAPNTRLCDLSNEQVDRLAEVIRCWPRKP